MLAVAAESVVKMAAFLAIGIFVTFFIFGSPAELVAHGADNEAVRAVAYLTSPGTCLTLTVLRLRGHAAAAAVLCDHRRKLAGREVRRARWLFPLYLVAINLFVIPIALAGPSCSAP